MVRLLSVALVVLTLVACGKVDTPPTCTRGGTRYCHGPGDCAGAQICLDDGTGYGACDCGDGPDSRSGASDAATSSADPAGATDASVIEAGDASADAAADGGFDASTHAAIDAGTDAAVDAGTDAAVDASADAAAVHDAEAADDDGGA